MQREPDRAAEAGVLAQNVAVELSEAGFDLLGGGAHSLSRFGELEPLGATLKEAHAVVSLELA